MQSNNTIPEYLFPLKLYTVILRKPGVNYNINRQRHLCHPKLLDKRKIKPNNCYMTESINEKYVRLLVSKNLRRLRSLQNISQLSLALNTGLTHNFINDIENCKKGISAKTLAKLANALEAKPHQFFLPDELVNDSMKIYVNDFNDSLQKIVKDLTAQYLNQMPSSSG